MKPEDYKTINDILAASVTGEEDDDSLLLERTVSFLARLPTQSRESQMLTDGFINTLWTSLVHPPLGSISNNDRYRTADGSNNNILNPSLGAANTPYAHTVSPLVFQGPNFPDAGLIFDSIMTRADGSFKEDPNKLSSQLFYLAIIITHDVFQTNHHDSNINLASSYLDLSPLYASNHEEQKAMIIFKQGLLKLDCFSNENILSLPPGVGVFLIMFNRFHNYVAGNLAMINEGGRFGRPDAKHATWDEWVKYDEDLFQSARLITCGLYVNIMLKDYVRTILNLNRSGSAWDLDPRSKENKSSFNANPAAATVEEIEQAFMRSERSISNNPEDSKFAGLSRDSDNTYCDDDLVTILTSSIEDVAGAFGANQVPQCCEILEIMGIEQSRDWHVATLNEFRQHFQLKKHETFEDINPDPAVARKLESLYDSPDAVELYPGLVAEKTKPPVDGSGLCVHYTTSRAILSDAVALVRGDRFYTIDYTPRNLANWGYNEANFDLGVNQGQIMHKLIFRAFPNHFLHNSIHAHFPFIVPSENRNILEKLKTASKYSWDKPARKVDPVVLKSHETVSKVLSNNKNFYVPWGEAISYLVSPGPDKIYGREFCLSGDGAANQQSRAHVNKCLYAPTQWKEETTNFFKLTTHNLLEKARRSLPGGQSKEVDIIRDVINPLNTRFIAAFFGLPIKTSETPPHGIYTEYELYMLLTAMFITVCFDSDPANSFKLHTTARELALQLEKLVQCSRDDHHAGAAISMSRLIPWRWREALTYQSSIVWHTRAQMKLMIVMHYMLEGIRLRGTIDVARFVPPTSKAQTVSDWAPCIPNPDDPTGPSPVSNPDTDKSKRIYTIRPYQRIIIDLVTASHDQSAFPEPETLRLDRSLDSYLPWGLGPHKWRQDREVSAREVEFKEWRGQVGRKAVEGGGDEWTGLRVYLSAGQSSYWPVPTTVRVRWKANQGAIKNNEEDGWVELGEHGTERS
ncbi:fatty acid oxygenase [Paramyrothecium foliicola]|nr:fatty acid oxygenase [Paramyrothecium foliicola]